MKRHYDSDMTRKIIAEKAAQLFSQKGFAGTSVSDISKESGFSKGHVYYHFENKEKLFVYLAQDGMRVWGEKWSVLSPNYPSATEKLYAMAKFVLDNFKTPLLKVGQELADLFQLAHARDGIAHPARLEVGDRQSQHMPEQLRPERDVDATRRMREQIRAQRTEDGLEKYDGEHADGDDMQRRGRLVDQHLVDHDLEKERRHQRKELNKERGDQYLAQQLAVLDDSGNEPRKVELAIFRPQPRALGKENETPGPLGLKRLARHEVGPGFERIVDQHPFGIGTGD